MSVTFNLEVHPRDANATRDWAVRLDATRDWAVRLDATDCRAVHLAALVIAGCNERSCRHYLHRWRVLRLRRGTAAGDGDHSLRG